jgi:hypothetical protein
LVQVRQHSDRRHCARGQVSRVMSTVKFNIKDETRGTGF